MIMDLDGALDVADKVADRELSWAEHPSMINMIYALQILAADYRTMRDKAQAWEKSYQARVLVCDHQAQKLRDVKDALQSLNGLVEFMRSALNLDAHALDDPDRARKILGRAFADARLWARVKDMAAGKFTAGDVVTADVMNAFGQAVMTANGLKLMGADTSAVFAAPTAQEFPAGSPEPPERVTVVECHTLSTPLRFVRVAQTVNGDSLWRLSDRPSSTELWMWKDITEEPSREVLPT